MPRYVMVPFSRFWKDSGVRHLPVEGPDRGPSFSALASQSNKSVPILERPARRIVGYQHGVHAAGAYCRLPEFMTDS